MLRLAMLPTAALVLASCDPALEQQYYKEGIGTDFTRPDIANQTALQDLYLSELCRQAGFLGADGLCQPAGLNQNWGMIVEAGMNDIDERCDAYLSWLDDKRRSQEPILSEINALQTASQSIMRVSGVGADPITMVGLAFGLASNTFTNIRSRLLLEANHSTVQSIVLGRQKDYREGLMKQSIVTRAEAVYALRSYLRICMPMTIEMQINTTVVVYEQAGINGLAIKRADPLIDPQTVTRHAPVAQAPVTAAPLTSGQKVAKPERVIPPPPDGLTDIVPPTGNDQLRNQVDLVQLQSALCAQADGGTVGPLTKAQIRMFKVGYPLDNPLRDVKQVNSDEVRQIKRQGECKPPLMNYYEKSAYGPDGQVAPGSRQQLALNTLTTALDKFIPEKPIGTISSLTPALRNKIKVARDQLTKQKVRLEDYGVDVSDQVTRDFVAALVTATR
ncbi:MAG TPA: hypothetical protein VFB02_04120 [Bradyrhizobium sp.]|nr:hypothetical protein [Bradyrhizobium sp.]